MISLWTLLLFLINHSHVVDTWGTTLQSSVKRYLNPPPHLSLVVLHLQNSVCICKRRKHKSLICIPPLHWRERLFLNYYFFPYIWAMLASLKFKACTPASISLRWSVCVYFNVAYHHHWESLEFVVDLFSGFDKQACPGFVLWLRDDFSVWLHLRNEGW